MCSRKKWTIKRVAIGNFLQQKKYLAKNSCYNSVRHFGESCSTASTMQWPLLISEALISLEKPARCVKVCLHIKLVQHWCIANWMNKFWVKWLDHKRSSLKFLIANTLANRWKCQWTFFHSEERPSKKIPLERKQWKLKELTNADKAQHKSVDALKTESFSRDVD